MDADTAQGCLLGTASWGLQRRQGLTHSPRKVSSDGPPACPRVPLTHHLPVPQRQFSLWTKECGPHGQMVLGSNMLYHLAVVTLDKLFTLAKFPFLLNFVNS